MYAKCPIYIRLGERYINICIYTHTYEIITNVNKVMISMNKHNLYYNIGIKYTISGLGIKQTLLTVYYNQVMYSAVFSADRLIDIGNLIPI